MPFEPGHKHHEARIMPGRSKPMARAAQNLAIAIRDRVPIELMIRWHEIILTGKQPMAVMDEDGDRIVDVIPEVGGYAPTARERNEAIRFLVAYGHGQPAQSIHLEGAIRTLNANVNLDLPTRALTPAAVSALARLLLPGSSQALPAPNPPVIDVLGSERAGSPLEALPTPPAPTPDTPATGD